MHELAIVIPAYKSTYLAPALDSIAAQTCHDFTLYIGDDCSPNHLKDVVECYKDKIDIVYKRFDKNLGGSDLVAQWERCINLTQGEKWLWLFSDDDIMEPRCVECFFSAMREYPTDKLFHFNIKRIDYKGDILSTPFSWTSHITARQYLDGKLKGKYNTYVVEFIFQREIFLNVGRFQSYDLAWGSDFITWLKLADKNKGIRTIEGAKVCWRDSGENISPNKEPAIIFRKMKSVILYTKYVTDYAHMHNLGKPWFYGKYAIGELQRNRHLLSKDQFSQLVKYYMEINNWIKPVKVAIRILFSCRYK